MYPMQFEQGQKRIVYLEGEAFFDVTKDSQRPFIVQTKNMNIRVLGTQFSVNSYENNSNTFVALLEGSVKAYPAGEKFYSENAVLLKPNQMATLINKSTSMHQEDVDVKRVISWMQKGISFRDMPFKDVLNTIERHFDVHIECDPSILNNSLFTASFTDESLEEVLETIQRYRNFEYQIKDKLITISIQKNENTVP